MRVLNPLGVRPHPFPGMLGPGGSAASRELSGFRRSSSGRRDDPRGDTAILQLNQSIAVCAAYGPSLGVWHFRCFGVCRIRNPHGDQRTHPDGIVAIPT